MPVISATAIVALHRKAAAFLILTSGLILTAQEALPPIQFNVPYRCADGNTYTFLRCEPGRKAEICTFYIVANGRRESDRYNVRSQLTGILNSCQPPAAQKPATQTSAAQPGGPPPLPQGIPNRPTDPPYIREFPPPERVISEIHGANPSDTASRQIAVFLLLERIVERVVDAKRYRKTPDEEQVRYTYRYYAWKLEQDFAKTHSPEEKAAMLKAQSRYDMDEPLYNETIAKFYTPNIRAQHAKVDAAFDAQYRARVAESKREQAAIQQQQVAQPQGNPGFAHNDPGTLAARRCVELGGSDLGCVGKAFMTGLFGDEVTNLVSGKDASQTGLVMTGRYNSPGNIGVWFEDLTMGLGDCGKLIIDSRRYSVTRNGNRYAVAVDSNPKPFTMMLGPDGILTGPGPVEIQGKIITGYRRVWMQKYENGYPVAGGYYVDEPIYAPKIERCMVGALRPTGPTGTLSSGLSMVMDFAAGKPAEKAAQDAEKSLPAPGVRVVGHYGAPGGLALEFRTDSVILDCAEAHVARPYSVENTANHVAIHVKNGGTPFTLALQPNGALTGSGTIDVVGRVATGTTQDGIAFAQRTGRCGLGTLPPKGAPPSAPGLFTGGLPSSSAQPAAPPAGSAVLSVSSGMPAKPGLPNPLGSVTMYLVKESFAAVAARNGVQPTAGQNAVEAWGAACENKAPECTQSMTAIKALVASRLKFDLDGRASFAGVPPGKYYVFGFILYEGRHLVWDMAIDLKNGPNAIVIDQRNAYSIK